MKIAALLAATALLTLTAGPASGPRNPASRSQQDVWQPGGGRTQIPLWPADLAIAKPDLTGAESLRVNSGGPTPVTWIENVERPTMTVFPAQGTNTGAAVLVFPGGGYRMLAIDLEGTDVCDWLTPKGITCIVLKYRVPGSGHHWDAACRCARMPAVPMALQDAQRAMVLLRHRAREFGIDPHKIGVLGFSAGGHLVTAVSNAETLQYDRVDTADAETSRPDFGVVLYPGHLWTGTAMEMHGFNTISRNAPPQLIIQAQDDPVDDVRNSVVYYLALREAGGARRDAPLCRGRPRLRAQAERKADLALAGTGRNLAAHDRDSIGKGRRSGDRRPSSLPQRPH